MKSQSNFQARAPYIALAALLIFTLVWGYFVCIRDSVFIVFDQANIALVARNLLRGKGFMTDALWVWTRDWGTPYHPEDNWPLLQPVITAISFLILGQNVAAEKAICILSLMALIIATFYVGKRLFGPWTGVLAAALVLPNDRIAGIAAYGLNDIGAAFFFLCAIYAIHRSFEERSGYKRVIIAAVWTGVAINFKFQGLFLIPSFILWQAGRLRADRAKALARAAVFMIVLTAMGIPMMVRNIRTFGNLSYPSSAVVTALGSAWDPSIMRWRSQIVYYDLYWKHTKPGYGFLLKHRGAKYLFVKKPIYELTRMAKLFADGVMITRLILIFAILGAIAAWNAQRPWVKWNALTMFVSMGWIALRSMEPRYYLFMAPLAAILAAHFIAWSAARFKAAHTIFAVLFIGLCAVFLIYTARSSYSAAAFASPAQKSYGESFEKLSDWLKSHLAPDEGAMCWNAAELAFQIDRPVSTIPNADLADWIQLADRYKLRYIVLNNARAYFELFKQPGTQYWMLRQLAPLFAGQNAYGFTLQYQDGGDILIYRIPRPGELDLAALPKLPPEPDDFTLLLLPPERGGLKESPPPLSFFADGGVQ